MEGHVVARLGTIRSMPSAPLSTDTLCLLIASQPKSISEHEAVDREGVVFLASDDAYIVSAAIYDLRNGANESSSRAIGFPHRRRVVMNIFIEYFKLIDLLALAALAALACAALVRNGSIWLFVAAILVAIWGAMRVMGWP